MDAEEMTSEDEVNEQEQEEQVEESAVEQEPGSESEEKPDIEVPEVDPKDAVIGGFRRDLRDSRTDNQALRDRLDAQDQVIADLKKTTEPVEKSPIEKLAEEDPEAMPDAGTLARQSAWEAKQRANDTKRTQEAETKRAQDTTQQQRTTAINTAQETAAKTFSSEAVGVGLDFETVITMGEKYLTPGQKLDIQNADPDKVWDLAYRECKRSIIASGSAEAKLLQQREAAHKKAGGGKPKREVEEKEENTVVEPSEGEYSHISSFMFDGDNAEG